MWRAVEVTGKACAMAFLLLAAPAWAQSKPPGRQTLAIVADTVPRPVTHTPYSFHLVAQGGTLPYTWKIEKGELPPGLHLQENTGIISGIPQKPGELKFAVRVTDSAEPPASAERELTVTAIPALQLEWRRRPALQDDGIYGEVKVGNPSKDAYDLTFIIVAVNQIGKAFALGYQHFTLRPEATQAISFGASLPQGSYIVHADAVGEIPAKDSIRRARLQTPNPLIKE